MNLKLSDEQLEKVTNLEFKKEGLGALEFDLKIVDETWEEKPVHFRVERVSPQTYLKITAKDNVEDIMPEVLKNFIAQPSEARNLDFYKYGSETMGIISNIITSFQETPLLFNRGIEGIKEILSRKA